MFFIWFDANIPQGNKKFKRLKKAKGCALGKDSGLSDDDGNQPHFRCWYLFVSSIAWENLSSIEFFSELMHLPWSNIYCVWLIKILLFLIFFLLVISVFFYASYNDCWF